MNKTELQKTAEHVIDVEARVADWRGNISGLTNELSRLLESIEHLIHVGLNDNDPTRNAFLKCLHLKTNRCRENVLKRTNRMDFLNEPGFLEYEHSAPMSGCRTN